MENNLYIIINIENLQLPYLEITENGKKFEVAQSLAISRFLANRFNLAGKNEHDRTIVEMYAEQVRDIQEEGIKAKFEKDEQKKNELTDKFFNELLPKNLQFFETRLAKNGTGFFAGDSLTWVDLYVYYAISWLDQSKIKQHLDKSPNVRKLIEKVLSNPGVADYLKKRPATDFQIFQFYLFQF